MFIAVICFIPFQLCQHLYLSGFSFCQSTIFENKMSFTVWGICICLIHHLLSLSVAFSQQPGMWNGCCNFPAHHRLEHGVMLLHLSPVRFDMYVSIRQPLAWFDTASSLFIYQKISGNRYNDYRIPASLLKTSLGAQFCEQICILFLAKWWELQHLDKKSSWKKWNLMHRFNSCEISMVSCYLFFYLSIERPALPLDMV